MKTNIFFYALFALALMACSQTPNEPINNNNSNPTYIAKGIVELVNNTPYFIEVGTDDYSFAAVLGAYEKQTINMKSSWYTYKTIRAIYYNPKNEDEELFDRVTVFDFQPGKDYRIIFNDKITIQQITE